MKNNHFKIVVIALSLLCSCQKDFLSERPDKALLIPTKLEDFEALLDNSHLVMNRSPYLTILSSDEIVVSDVGLSIFSAYTTVPLNAYLWKENIYGPDDTHDWETAYQQIFYANIALEGIDELLETETNALKRKEIRGRALFFRGLAHYNLSQLFAVQYKKETASNDLGIPLKLSSDVNEQLNRGTLQMTYDQILEDLLEAKELLPDVDRVKTRPSRIAAFGLLARVYLTMGDYHNALTMSNSCLGIRDRLVDYNDLDFRLAYPMPPAIPFNQDIGNMEVIFYSGPFETTQLTAKETRINSDIIDLYGSNDLRRHLYLNDNNNFRGSYRGSIVPFTGIAIDEIYLIRAEANTRLNNIKEGNEDLDKLLLNRYKLNTYERLDIQDKTLLLKRIFDERRKELLYRGLRWSDLRRLNLESEFATILVRKGIDYDVVLEPNSNRYVFPIPLRELDKNKIKQNPR